MIVLQQTGIVFFYATLLQLITVHGVFFSCLKSVIQIRGAYRNAAILLHFTQSILN